MTATAPLSPSPIHLPPFGRDWMRCPRGTVLDPMRPSWLSRRTVTGSTVVGWPRMSGKPIRAVLERSEGQEVRRVCHRLAGLESRREDRRWGRGDARGVPRGTGRSRPVPASGTSSRRPDPSMSLRTGSGRLGSLSGASPFALGNGARADDRGRARTQDRATVVLLGVLRRGGGRVRRRCPRAAVAGGTGTGSSATPSAPRARTSPPSRPSHPRGGGSPRALQEYRGAYILAVRAYELREVKPMRSWTLPFLIRHSALLNTMTTPERGHDPNDRRPWSPGA